MNPLHRDINVVWFVCVARKRGRGRGRGEDGGPRRQGGKELELTQVCTRERKHLPSRARMQGVPLPPGTKGEGGREKTRYEKQQLLLARWPVRCRCAWMNTRAVVCLNTHALVFLLMLTLFTWVVFGAWGHGYLQCVCAQSRTKPCPPTCNNTATNYTTKRPFTYSANTQYFFFFPNKKDLSTNQAPSQAPTYKHTYARHRCGMFLACTYYVSGYPATYLLDVEPWRHFVAVVARHSRDVCVRELCKCERG
jgi:hypothetical protein